MEKGAKVIGKISLVDKALAKHATLPTATAVTKALELKKAQDEERESKRILEALVTIEGNTKRAVEALQLARKIEKDTKQFLKELAEAEEAFLTNADFDKYNEAVKSAQNKTLSNLSKTCTIIKI